MRGGIIGLAIAILLRLLIIGNGLNGDVPPLLISFLLGFICFSIGLWLDS